MKYDEDSAYFWQQQDQKRKIEDSNDSYLSTNTMKVIHSEPETRRVSISKAILSRQAVNKTIRARTIDRQNLNHRRKSFLKQ